MSALFSTLPIYKHFFLVSSSLASATKINNCKWSKEITFTFVTRTLVQVYLKHIGHISSTQYYLPVYKRKNTDLLTLGSVLQQVRCERKQMCSYYMTSSKLWKSRDTSKIRLFYGIHMPSGLTSFTRVSLKTNEYAVGDKLCISLKIEYVFWAS